MSFAIIALYCLVSALASCVAIILVKRRLPYDWPAYFVVGLVGGWIGGALFGGFGPIVSGISVMAVAVGAAFLIEVDYFVDCHLDDKAKLRARENIKNKQNSVAEIQIREVP